MEVILVCASNVVVQGATSGDDHVERLALERLEKESSSSCSTQASREREPIENSFLSALDHRIAKHIARVRELGSGEATSAPHLVDKRTDVFYSREVVVLHWSGEVILAVLRHAPSQCFRAFNSTHSQVGIYGHVTVLHVRNLT